MKFTLVASALASFFVLYGNILFSADMLGDVGIFNPNDGNNKQSNGINGKNLFKTKDSGNGEYDRSSKVGRALVSGQAISYMWASSDEKKSFYDISGSADDWGMNCDAILRLGAEIKSNDSGVKYGADFQIAIPHVQGKNFEKKAALNRGSRIFASTPYGDFSMGYQEGVESMMKIDSSNIVAGDESSSWTQHLRGVLSEKKNALGYTMYPFLFSAGLYSENVFRNNDNMTSTVDSSKDFMNNLPFRISYQSPNFMGLRFGVSYSPLGYKFQHFGRTLDIYSVKANKVVNRLPSFQVQWPSASVNLNELIDALQTAELSGRAELKQGRLDVSVPYLDLRDLQVTLSGLESISTTVPIIGQGNADVNIKTQGAESIVTKRSKNKSDQVFFGAKYEHILSGSVAYSYDLSNAFKFSTSLVGEYARPRLYFNTQNYDIYPENYNLQGISIGSLLSYSNINFAIAYGYLGHSGFAKHYILHKKIKDSGENSIYPMCERSNTYYWDIAFRYQYKSSNISITYFKSNRSGNVLQDISLGVEYHLLKEQSKMRCKLFGNYHYYKFSEIAIAVDNVQYESYGSESQARKTPGNDFIGKGLYITNNVRNTSNGSGNIFLVGAKLEF
ncbi:gram-negative porin family protein [Ehrlichia chaffeensis str. Liberty]|uniref:porin n=1 Tax=Ehrlichia chaffeensis TaxID=945 RepID=UPI000444E38F|nr:porin [Ehrlichia chaffeensis]AHX05659.1 gram-negative porin family protein [Ehrlichia chaffeensis str. Jax]AHX06650.1 gram-negative porin family protein [Ehrlichia chaffeensis str. Liberty]